MSSGHTDVDLPAEDACPKKKKNGSQYERKSARLLSVGAARLPPLQHRQHMAAFSEFTPLFIS